MTALDRLDIVADLSAILASVAVLVTTVFVWRQVSLMAADTETDARRFYRETLAAIHDTLQDPVFVEARRAFFDGAHARVYDDLEREEREAARQILSVYGLLSQMVQHGAVDEAVLREYWRSSLLRDWERLENFVSGERLRFGDGTMFATTERMVARWEAERG